jgi:hypothetical protein
MTSYSVDMLKRSAFQDELNNVLALEKTRIRVGGMMHSYVVSYLKQRIEEIDRLYKDV